MNDLVRKISNRTRLILKKVEVFSSLTFIHLFVRSFEIYKFLGVEQVDGIKTKEVYSRVKEEVKKRVKLILNKY